MFFFKKKLGRSRCASYFNRSDGTTTVSCAVLVSRSPVPGAYTHMTLPTNLTVLESDGYRYVKIIIMIDGCE